MHMMWIIITNRRNIVLVVLPLHTVYYFSTINDGYSLISRCHYNLLPPTSRSLVVNTKLKRYPTNKKKIQVEQLTLPLISMAVDNLDYITIP